MARRTVQETRLVVLGLFVWCLSVVDAEYRVLCTNNTGTSVCPLEGTSLKPAEDGVKGRYTVEWCTDVNHKDKIWNIEITYNPKNHTNCLNRNKHTSKSVDLDNLNVNCSYVCLYTDVDLIFSTCYTVQNWFPARGSMRCSTNHHISNEFTLETFSENNFLGNTIDHGDYVAAHWYLGYVPATHYDIELCKNMTTSPHYERLKCEDVTSNCSTSVSSPQRSEVVCRLRGLRGDYDMRLSLAAPWAGADFMVHKKNAHMTFRAQAAGWAGGVGAAGGWGAWAAGAAGAAAAGAALLALALRWRRARSLRKLVLRHWLHREERAPPPASSRAHAGAVLLVYAREGPAGAAVVLALKRLLDTALPGKVIDICSPETVALAASGGAEWVRRVVHSAGVRVLLLQTPALQALHEPRLRPGPGGPTLEQPLLSRRVLYRAPAPADTLLPLVLRLLAHAAPAAPYHTYYLATLEGLETDTLPYTVPFRRYLLPTHALTLLDDLAGGPGGPGGAGGPGGPGGAGGVGGVGDGVGGVGDGVGGVGDGVGGVGDGVGGVGDVAGGMGARLQRADEVSRAVLDFVDHARANPDYLMDELLFITD